MCSAALWVAHKRAVQILTTLSELLAVEEPKLEAMLTQRVVTTRGEVFTKQLSLSDARLTRDAIVKSLYEVRASLGGRYLGTPRVCSSMFRILLETKT